MRLIWKLLTAQFRRHWVRTLLALAALVTSVSMVIVFVGGQDVTMARAGVASAKAAEALGRFDLLVLSVSTKDAQAARMAFGVQPPRPAMNDATLKWLRSNPDIRTTVECCEAGVEASPPGKIFRAAAYVPGQNVNAPLFGTASREPPYPMDSGKWLGQAGQGEVVIDRSMAARLVPPEGPPAARTGPPSGAPPGMGGPFALDSPPPRNTVGSRIQIITQTGRHDVRICGVIKAHVRARGLVGVYALPATFERLIGRPANTNRIMVDLKPGVSAERFAERLDQAAKAAAQPVHVQTPADFQAQAAQFASMPQRSAAGFFPLLRNAGMNLAILAAMFIIFSTLNMGLQERSRQLAMLRAIGMTRGQVVGLIVAEVSVLSVAGWLVGVAVGWGVMRYILQGLPGPAGQDLELHAGL